MEMTIKMKTDADQISSKMECGFNIVGFECCMVASADRSNRKRSAVLIILALNAPWLQESPITESRLYRTKRKWSAVLIILVLNVPWLQESPITENRLYRTKRKWRFK